MLNEVKADSVGGQKRRQDPQGDLKITMEGTMRVLKGSLCISLPATSI